MSSVVIRATPVVDDARLLDLLDDGERERADRRRDPNPFVTAHALLRRLVADETGADPRAIEFEKRCATCGTDKHGKPHVVGHRDLFVSVSYGERAAVAAVTRLGEVGVDVEDFASTDFDGFPSVTLDASEQGYFADLTGNDLLAARATTWARKEAILKATGHGLVVDPSEVLVSAPDVPAELLEWKAKEHPPGPTQVRDVSMPWPDHRAAVAVLTDRELDLDVHTA
ncbi:4'-phosphopantetheinyl transferase [Knoellia remsis]|uniref:4'-phosphopantetheinyl transferase n=1 Tax=Knoellia remsis TaxID=407159 RepID=A0A2T0UTY2_9MICO|nr:4'-phosphopantetheinyl transferase superfamily protein [Knoellia remsis]PRY61354.1 4'-phosphopantetheinyl transferase [Knoellia remsis]